MWFIHVIVITSICSSLSFKNSEGLHQVTIIPVYLLRNPVALRTAKTLWSFGHSECKRVKGHEQVLYLRKCSYVHVYITMFFLLFLCVCVWGGGGGAVFFYKGKHLLGQSVYFPGVGGGLYFFTKGNNFWDNLFTLQDDGTLPEMALLLRKEFAPLRREAKMKIANLLPMRMCSLY